MKKLRLLLVMYIGLICQIFITSCQKDNYTSSTLPVKMENLHVPSTFDWKTARVVGTSITNLAPGVVRITSVDGRTLFSKGYFSGSPSIYQLSLSLPTTVKEIQINNERVTIPLNNFLNYAMLNLKSLVNSKSVFFNGGKSLLNTDTSLGIDTDRDGVIDSDDDYPNDFTKAFNNYFPSERPATLVFEDFWPLKGDYDYNDLVVDYQFKTITNIKNKVSEVDVKFIIRAAGSNLENGFGFQLPMPIPDADITVTGSSIKHNLVKLNSNGTEAGQDKTTIIVFDDVFDLMTNPGIGVGVNTAAGAPYVTPDTLHITMTFKPDTYSTLDIGLEKFNPFIFIDKNRGREVHLPDYTPTSLANLTLFGTGDDNSNVTSARYYKTQNNLPWAINISSSFSYTNETEQIVNGYRYFTSWAQSGGTVKTNWYLDLSGYRNTGALYKKP